MERVLKWRDSKGYLGYVGDSTSHPEYKVGDAIVFKNKYMHENLVKTIICKDSGGMDYAMGLKGVNINKLVKEMEVVKVVSFEHLTDEVCEGIIPGIMVDEAEVREFTILQLEQKLGCKIKIIK